MQVSSSSCVHLVGPGSAAQHLGALETGGQAPGGELGALGEQRHVDALAQVHQHQAVLHLLGVQTLALQEPAAHRTGTSGQGGRFWVQTPNVHSLTPIYP